MINLRVMQPSTGRVFFTVMRANWVTRKELAVLPDKIARYLYEYHAESYASHDLPVLPDDRSRTDVHGVLKPHQVV